MYFYDVGFTGTHFLQSKFLDILDSCCTSETSTFIDHIKYYFLFEPCKILDIKFMLSLMIIVTEPDFPYLEALAPFQPLQMKV